jgi:abhydrolase domain-containing protein 5
VLVCPAGVGKRPDDWEKKIPPALKNPFTIRGMLFRTAKNFWDWGFTPGGLVRALGPLGKSIVLGYTQRRFITGDHLTEEEVAAFSDYMYGITSAKGSGEYALRHILMPFAFARSPLEIRMAELTVPVSFIYGESDWMDRQAGHRAIDSIKARRPTLNDGDCKLVEIRNAGHYCQIEQKNVFFKEMLGCLGLDSSAMVAEEEAGEAIETAEQLEEEWNTAPMSAATHVVEGL